MSKILEKIPHADVADKYWNILRNIFPRGWITDVKAIYVEETGYKKIYVCLKLDAYDKLLDYTVHAFRIESELKKYRCELAEYERHQKFNLSDLIFGGKLHDWLNEYEIDDLFLIDGGYPYHDKAKTYYSAKNKKLFDSPVPPTRTFSENEKYKINPCIIFGKDRIVNTTYSSITIDAYGYKDNPLIVTHSFDSLRKIGEKFNERHDVELSDSQKSIAESINSCGGLLFPSLALSKYSQNQFGYNTLVFNTELIKSWFSKRPKVSKTLPYYIYESDGWTGVSAGYFGSFSEHLYDEYFDGFDVMYHNLSAYASQSIATENNKFIETHSGIKLALSERQLARSLNHKNKMMDKVIKNMKNKEDPFDGLEAHDNYWLSEIKFSKIVDINCFLMCICPDYMYKNTKLFLDSIGFTGKIIPLHLEDSLRSKMMKSNYLAKYEIEYSMLVREKILELSKMSE